MSILLFIVACGGDISSKIVGEWECARLKQTLNLDFVGGARLIATKVGYANYEGSYEVDGKVLTLNFPRFSRPVVRTVKSVSGSKLVLLDSNGIKEVYVRK